MIVRIENIENIHSTKTRYKNIVQFKCNQLEKLMYGYKDTFLVVYF